MNQLALASLSMHGKCQRTHSGNAGGVGFLYSQIDALSSIGTVEKLFPRLPSTAAGAAWNMSSEHRQGLHNVETKEAGYRCRPVCFRCTPGRTGRLDPKRGGMGRDGTKPNEKSETKRDGKGRDNGIIVGALVAVGGSCTSYGGSIRFRCSSAKLVAPSDARHVVG